jgi:serine/threonine-protein kinase
MAKRTQAGTGSGRSVSLDNTHRRGLSDPGPSGPIRTGPPGAEPPPSEVHALPAPLEGAEPLARGGFGAVLKATDGSLLRTVAVKVFDPPRATGEAALRFREEAQITGQLDHPNIVPVYQLGETATGRPFFTMKLVPGTTLLDVLRLPPEEPLSSHKLYELLQIFLRVCDAVAFAHSRGVLHRDLKPENVMVGDHGQVYLMDWGLAQLFDPSAPAPQRARLGRERKVVEGAGAVAGTVAYMSPEQAHGLNARLDERTDVFGLGAVLYQLLTGRPPHRGKTATEKLEKARRCEIEPPQEVAPQRVLPPALCRIAMQALSANPADRFSSAEALRAEVVRFLQGGGWFTSRTFAPGERIVGEDEKADAAYIVTGGICEAYRMVGGRREWLRTMGPGDVFGETAIFADEPRTASVQAVTAVTAMQVTRESLTEELGLDSWVGAFVKALAVRFRELDREVVALRHAREENELHREALEHLALAGRDVEGGRAAAWGPLAADLARRTGRTPAELAELLARTGLEVDLAADRLRLARR